MKKVFPIIQMALLCLSFSANSQTIGDHVSSPNYSKEYAKEAQEKLKSEEIDTALVLYAKSVEDAQKHRNGGKGVGGDLLAEYAYALALHHNFEAALINIDRAKALGAKYGNFYASQILTLMGYNEAAEQFIKGAKVPEWISDTYQTLNSKYAKRVSINIDEPQDALKRANKLAACDQTIQAVALFEELLSLYPDVYLTYIDYSAIWENFIAYEYASKLLKKGVELIPPQDGETKAVFSKHLEEVNLDFEQHYSKGIYTKRLTEKDNSKLMAYFGASFAGKTLSLNGRIGSYSNKKFSCTFNYCLLMTKGQFNYNLGVSIYKGWGIFFAGLGFTESLLVYDMDTNITLGISPQVGLSFMNKAQSASFDVTFGSQIPFSLFNDNAPISYYISIGETIYIDIFNKKK